MNERTTQTDPNHALDLPVIEAFKPEGTPTAAVTDSDRLYICPGEEYPITRSVHLARLAAFYPKCARCALRTDTGELRQKTVRQLEQARRRITGEELFRLNGVRGVHRNRLTRQLASDITAAFSALLWEHAPLMGLSSLRQQEAAASGLRGPARPTVIAGYDDRPSSPDLFVGAVAGLRRMGCQVIELGQVTRPQVWFACQHLDTAGGIHVTGCGEDPSINGIDLVAREACPVSRRKTTAEDLAAETRDASARWLFSHQHPSLDRIEMKLEQPIPRFTRHAGIQKSFRIQVPYEASLRKNFEPVRGVKLAVACSTRLIRTTWQSLLEDAGVEVHWVELPVRKRTFESGDPDVERLSLAVRNVRADAGVLVGDDAQQLLVLDEMGEPITQEAVTLLGATKVVHKNADRPVILSPSTKAFVGEWLRQAGGEVRNCKDSSLAAVSMAMREHSAGFANVGDHRYWFSDVIPTCDASLILGHLIATLGASEHPLSRVSREFERGLRTAGPSATRAA